MADRWHLLSSLSVAVEHFLDGQRYVIRQPLICYRHVQGYPWLYSNPHHGFLRHFGRFACTRDTEPNYVNTKTFTKPCAQNSLSPVEIIVDVICSTPPGVTEPRFCAKL